ncbi:lipopolysaccharide export system permease protein [Paucibacter oligotrophus]|uniref:Lipopolysaccharide export system permease protein n=1 Tax=Roseateles oligotrophus TaxID=1769250 RepID=A0A840L3Z7_9BURK|nr:LPS export ABC transporter permease LptG [Roseateles oligotrophus]MBB4841573.1 lipopolysaccharide export system permease protein [Roseateles oligotrophus]
MRTVRRLLYRDIVGSVLFVSLAFLSLFYFIDFVDELERMSRIGAGAARAALLSLMVLPGHLYELLPIAVLIGSIFSLARMAQSSEFTILRTGGLGPRRALSLLATLALGFAVLTFAVGDFLAPYFDKQADIMRAQLSGDVSASSRGAWLKEHRVVAGEERNFSIHVGQASASGALQDVRIFEFNPQGGLIARMEAKKAKVDGRGQWLLEDVLRTEWLQAKGEAALAAPPVVKEAQLPSWRWDSSLHAGVVAAALLPTVSMSTLELYRYTEHLSAQEQSAQAQNIAFWRKAFYPFACFVMVALALPFAYLHGRAGGISLKVFGGIMLGISFVLLNNVAGHVGVLKDWTPWIVAASPSLAYMALSLAAFGWLVRYR